VDNKVSKCQFKNMILNNISIEDIDYSHLTDMSYLFEECYQLEEIPYINTSHVTNMEGMFKGCRNFNGEVNFLDVSKVTNMKLMFSECRKFNQPLTDWNVSNVVNMNRMFDLCTSFNQPLDTWEVDNVLDMGGMFNCSFIFNQPLVSWNVSKVENFDGMFYVPLHVIDNLTNVFESALSKGFFTPPQNSLLLGYGIEDPEIIEFNGYSSSLKLWEFNENANIFDMFLDHKRFISLLDQNLLIERLFSLMLINEFTYKSLLISKDSLLIEKYILNVLNSNMEGANYV